MKLADTIVVYGEAAGSQATGKGDSRKAEDWIKQFLDQKEQRLEELRRGVRAVKEVVAATNVYKDVNNQDPDKIADGGRWAVTDPEGLIISTHRDRPTAQRAASAQRYARVVDLGADNEYRRRFLKHPKPKAVALADFLRWGDQRPSSGGGAAGTGGAGGPSGS